MASTPLLAAAALAGTLLLSGCSIFQGGEDVQVLFTRTLVGMPAGDFFTRYGTAYTRSEQLDRTTRYDWVSRIGDTVAGPMSLDDRVCKLSLVADPGGRIASVNVVQDNPGRVSNSRCTEVLNGKQDVIGAKPQT